MKIIQWKLIFKSMSILLFFIFCFAIEKQIDGIVFELKKDKKTDPGLMKIQVCKEDIIRVIAVPEKTISMRRSVMVDKTNWRTIQWSVEGKGDQIILITSKLFMILIGVGIVGFFLAATQVPFMLADYVLAMAVNPYIVISAILLLFILMGCVLNVIPMILLVLPTLFPTVTALGFDPVWFGVVCVISMEMGQITPPIGVNVFAIGSVAPDVPMGRIFRGIVPFFFCMVLTVIILIIFPNLALFLVNQFY